MIILALDTCEARGSVALLRDGATIAALRHEADVDYSEWLLPSIEEILKQSGTKMSEVDLFAVATGPGSFTGLRVGLTTVKAWAEVYGKAVVGVSRLEAMGRTVKARTGLVAANYDAQRGQLFGGLFRRLEGRLTRVGEEMVISPAEFVDWVDIAAAEERVNWVSLDPELVTSLEAWKKRARRGDTMEGCAPELASAIGALAEERASSGEFSSPLELDANYVRRSDAELFWKGR